MQLGLVNGWRNARLETYALWMRWLEDHEAATKVGAAILMALVIGALAQVQIHTPLTPVPYTLQVLGVAFTGGILGRRWGALSASIYVFMGITGVPVYAGQLQTFHSFEWFSGWRVVTGA